MFNRSNLPFGGGAQQPPSPARGQLPPAQRGTDGRFGAAAPPSYGAHAGEKPTGRSNGRTLQLRPAKSPDNSYTFGNIVAVSQQDIPPSNDRSDVYLLINGQFVVSSRPHPAFPPGSISLSDAQRTWMQVALTDVVEVQPYDPFSQGAQNYLGAMDIEVAFAGRKSTEVPYDQDELAQHFIQVPKQTLAVRTLVLTSCRCSAIRSSHQDNRS